MKGLITLLLGAFMSMNAAANKPTNLPKLVADLRKAMETDDCKLFRKQFSNDMSAAFSEQACADMLKSIRHDWGKLTDLKLKSHQTPTTSVYLAEYERGAAEIVLVVANNTVMGLRFREPQKQVAAPTRNHTSMILPMEDLVYVFWGGKTKEQNHHHGISMQNHALDLVIRKDGKNFKGDGKTNDDYYCFGRPVIAPADGIVTEVIDGVRDNEPGSMNPYMALGNAVFIRHSKDEVSVLAHFKQNSIKVKKGAKVKQGQLLGLCGNSGNSSEAHLHYHLQHAEVFQDGVGIEVEFQNLTGVGGKKFSKLYGPVKGDFVKNQ